MSRTMLSRLAWRDARGNTQTECVASGRHANGTRARGRVNVVAVAAAYVFVNETGFASRVLRNVSELESSC